MCNQIAVELDRHQFFRDRNAAFSLRADGLGCWWRRWFEHSFGYGQCVGRLIPVRWSRHANSSSRAAIITGRNHHSVGFGVIAEQATGYLGYDAIIGIVATFFVTRGSQYPNVGARKTEFMLASPGKV
jgi:hypothetical protein